MNKSKSLKVYDFSEVDYADFSLQTGISRSLAVEDNGQNSHTNKTSL